LDLIDGGGESFRRFFVGWQEDWFVGEAEGKTDNSEQIAGGAEKRWRAIVGCLGPSTPRPDAPKNGAEEKVGPLRSG